MIVADGYVERTQNIASLRERYFLIKFINNYIKTLFKPVAIKMNSLSLIVFIEVYNFIASVIKLYPLFKANYFRSFYFNGNL